MALKQQATRLLAVPDIETLSAAAHTDYAICRDVMRAASKNYSFASAFLPADKLHHVEALYAFLRVGDDRVDVSHAGFPSPLAAIEDWERSYWHAFESGDSAHPVIRAYLNTAIECTIPSSIMGDYFRAMKQDLTIKRFPTFADLMHYMEGSAIPVGRGMVHILGIRNPYTMRAALPGADALSVGMQLSNFWRDIGEDWTRIGRIYIPQEDMDAFGYTESDLAQQRINQNFVALLEFEMERTEQYYALARQSVAMLASGQAGIMSGLEIYRAIMNSIRRNRYNVFTRRATTTRLEKLLLVARARWELARHDNPQHVQVTARS
jgi:15-cis-phytoene synthase